jgi:hypothetical protein
MTLEGYDYTLQEVVRRDDVTLVTMWKKKSKPQSKTPRELPE